MIRNIKININTVKCLGIYIGHNKTECNEKNWLCKLREFEKNIGLLANKKANTIRKMPDN